MSAAPVARVPEPDSGSVEGVLAEEGVWEKVRRLGELVDTRLAATGARLTMGWEPTFVSATDRQSRHWWVEPLAPEKLAAAWALGRALMRRRAAGGVLIEARGKSYPGEPEPRWSLACLWRHDGGALWRHRRWLGPAPAASTPPLAEARRFLLVLADRLGLPRFHVLPAFEAAEPGAPAGFVLPLGRDGGWLGEAWRLPEGPLILAPGAAPLGFRLPRERLKATGYRLLQGLTVEPRPNALRVFLPPLGDVDPWLMLLEAVEATAAEIGLPVLLAGHAPAAGPSLGRLDIAPDPGVLEVNMPPAASWPEWEVWVAALYAPAAEAGLDTRRYLLDGRPVGTGGGGHLLLGGATAEDSPFRRRPALLARMLGYWQNHPVLSYAFAGASVGPYGQYPRADESRPDALPELEVALAQLEAGRIAPHAALRHILVDPTGNPHRAEFCIDKLAPPEGNGLGGLLELRALDTQPTARMSLLLHLLVRALFAMLWQAPERARLRRWGGRLHDAFMLPEILFADLRAVLADLAEAGFAFEPTWFEPLRDARFPVLGRANAAAVTLELRAALEPLIALGEAGASRLVDSSIERLRIGLSGPRAKACRVLCNRHLLPLGAVPDEGSGAALGTGLRFRAWEPFDGLHPGIAPHAPLELQVIENDSGRCLLYCRYHSRAPDGTDYSGYPQHAAEAARRRAARFVLLPPCGAGEGGGSPRLLSTAPERPLTADLCRADLVGTDEG